MENLKYYLFVSSIFCLLSTSLIASKVKEIEIEKEIWDEPLGLSTFAGLTIASSGTSRSLLYENAGVVMQNVPALHPYNPVDNMNIGSYPYMPIAFRVPLADVLEKLPKFFQSRVVKLKKTPCQVFIAFQSCPWSAKTKVLFRPQYWMWPNATARMKGTRKEMVNVVGMGGKFKKPFRVRKAVSIHGPGYTILSGNNLCLGTAEDLIGKPLWTFVTASVGTKKMRSAITLHLPLESLQLQYIQRLLPESWMLNLAPHLILLPTMRSLYHDMIISQYFSDSPILNEISILVEKKHLKEEEKD